MPLIRHPIQNHSRDIQIGIEMTHPFTIAATVRVDFAAVTTRRRAP